MKVILSSIVIFITSTFICFSGHNKAPESFFFENRRNTLKETLKDSSILIIPSYHYYLSYKNPSLQGFNNENFLYLSSLEEIKGIVILSNYDLTIRGKNTNEILLFETPTHNEYLWTSKKVDQDSIRILSGIETSYSLNKLESLFKIILPQIKNVNIAGYSFTNTRVSRAGKIKDLVDKMKKIKDVNIFYGYSALNKQRMVKDTLEIKTMKEAAVISMKAHRYIWDYVKEKNSVSEKEIAAEFQYFSYLNSDGMAYKPIVAISNNTCFLHYTSYKEKKYDSSLLLMDCGIQYKGYASDISRTIPISGKYTKEERSLYDIVYKASRLAIDSAKKGKKIADIDLIARDYISKELIKLGIIDRKKQLGRYFSHGIGHYLGLNVHDPGDYSELENGNIITIEPGIYIHPNSPCDEKWWGIGIRIEDNIIINDNDPINITEDLPSSAEDIENYFSE